MLRGMEHLQEYLKTHKGSALAQAVGISASYLSDIKKGNRVPSLRVAFAIEDATNGDVPARSWVQEKTQ
jgi:transcriptional regulator with XRE-family HTH domain